MLHAAWCINHTAKQSISWRTPVEYVKGETPDISPLQFEFYERLFYLDPRSQYPQARERRGRFLGMAENVGHTFTYWILSDNDTLIARSCVRPINDDDIANSGEVNERAQTHDGESTTRDGSNDNNENEDYDDDNPEPTEPLEVVLDALNSDDGEAHYATECVNAHRYGRGTIEVRVRWTNGHESWEPLATIRADDPLSIAEYAQRKNLFAMRGFKWCKRYLREINELAAKLVEASKAFVRKSKRVMREQF